MIRLQRAAISTLLGIPTPLPPWCHSCSCLCFLVYSDEDSCHDGEAWWQGIASGQHVSKPCELQPNSIQVLNPGNICEGEFRSASILFQLHFKLVVALAVLISVLLEVVRQRPLIKWCLNCWYPSNNANNKCVVVLIWQIGVIFIAALEK